MAIEGTLDLFRLPDILQIISQQGKTGILTVQGEADIVAISFLDGRVVAADSLNQTLEESLGEVLAGQGMVSPAAFAGVAAEHQAGAGRLIDLLVERGHLDRLHLLEALRLQTYRLVAELLGWRAGEFKFYSGDEVSFEEGFDPIAVEELLIRSVEEAAEEGHPTIPDSVSTYHPVKPAPPIRVRPDGEEPPTRHGEVGVLWLTESEKELLDRLAGGRTVSQLVTRTGGDEYRVRYTLHRLLAAGAARRQGPPPPPARGEAMLPFAPSPSAPGAAPEPPPPVAPPPVQEEPITGTGLDASAVRRSAPRTPAALSSVWPGRLLALVPLALLLAVLARTPAVLTLPFPWQDEQRAALTKTVRASMFQKIDQAAKTYYLLERSFPERLEELVQRGLLAPGDLKDPLGRPLAYSPEGISYRLEPIDAAATQTGQVAEAVTGNFLLDPDFLSPAESDQQSPLVLLD